MAVLTQSVEGARPTKNTALLAGLYYLLAGLSGAFSFTYVPSLIVRNDPAATASHILAAETLFRAAIACELISAIAMIFLVVTLYRLFSATHATWALLMVVFGAASSPISFLNASSAVVALTFMKGAGFLSIFDRAQLDAWAMLFLGLHSQGLLLAQVFWGLWLLPAGLLMLASGYLRRVVGLFLIAACVGYVANCFVWLLLPDYTKIANQFMLVAAALGEVSFLLWLFLARVNVPPPAGIAR